MLLKYLSLLAAALAALYCEVSPAAQIAYDSAGDSAYNAAAASGGSFSGINGGYGWDGPWTGVELFMGSSSTNGTGDPTGSGDINSPRTPLGRAWGLRGDHQILGSTRAIRGLSGPLFPGQTLMIDFDSYIPLGGDTTGIGLGSVYFVAGSYSKSNYVLLDPATNHFIDTGIPLNDEGVHVELSALDASSSRVTVASFGSGNPMASFIVPYSPVDAIVIENAVHNYGNANVFFNNIAVTPEPGAGFVGVFCVAMVLLRRPVASPV